MSIVVHMRAYNKPCKKIADSFSFILQAFRFKQKPSMTNSTGYSTKGSGIQISFSQFGFKAATTGFGNFAPETK